MKVKYFALVSFLIIAILSFSCESTSNQSSDVQTKKQQNYIPDKKDCYGFVIDKTTCAKIYTKITCPGPVTHHVTGGGLKFDGGPKSLFLNLPTSSNCVPVEPSDGTVSVSGNFTIEVNENFVNTSTGVDEIELIIFRGNNKVVPEFIEVNLLKVNSNIITPIPLTPPYKLTPADYQEQCLDPAIQKIGYAANLYIAFKFKPYNMKKGEAFTTNPSFNFVFYVKSHNGKSPLGQSATPVQTVDFACIQSQSAHKHLINDSQAKTNTSSSSQSKLASGKCCNLSKNNFDYYDCIDKNRPTLHEARHQVIMPMPICPFISTHEK